MAKIKKKASKKAGIRKAGGAVSMRAHRAEPTDELAQIEAIFELMNLHGVAEIDWENDGTRLHVKTDAAYVAGGMMGASALLPRVSNNQAPAPMLPVDAPVPAAAAKAAGGLTANQKHLLSPFVGTFYRSPSPTADPCSREGQTVKRGDVLCIIEAMKLMNEIESEMDGRIVQIMVENGQPVEFGEPLFIIES